MVYALIKLFQRTRMKDSVKRYVSSVVKQSFWHEPIDKFENDKIERKYR